MYNTGGTEFCSFTTASGTTCEAPKSCSEFIGLTAATATGSSNLTTCNAKRDKTGPICTYADNATACSTATGADICTLLASGITADSDCDLKTTPKACKINSGACAASAACSSVAGANTGAC